MGRLCGLVCASLILTFLYAHGTRAVTDIMDSAEIRSDPASVKAIVSTFDRAEAALRAKNLSDIASVYSNAYLHWGLRKEDTVRIWGDIFRRYNRLSSRHLFTRIVVDPKGEKASVTCTGGLYGVPALTKKERPSPTAGSEPEPIDVWFEAAHHLALENGVWKIIGHDPVRGEEESFGAAIHLLF
jgi:hypothetical protein